MRKVVSTRKFIEKAIKVHGDRYDYSKSDYIGNLCKITIICPIHGEFHQTPDSHLRGKGCKRCGIEKSNNAKKLDYEFVRSKFEECGCILHDDRYVNSKTKMSYTCSCGRRSAIRYSDFSRGCRCKLCGIESRSSFKMIEAKEKIIKRDIKFTPFILKISILIGILTGILFCILIFI